MTDVELDARIKALEETGRGNIQNGKKCQEEMSPICGILFEVMM